MNLGVRNRVACAISNFALNHIATKWYRDMIGGSIRYGLRSAAVDAKRDEVLVFDHVKHEVRREKLPNPRA